MAAETAREAGIRRNAQGVSAEIESIRQKSGKLLSYPADLGSRVSGGQHYMLVTAHKTESASQTISNDATLLSEVSKTWALYIPPGALKTQYSQAYETLAGGRAAIQVGGALSAAVDVGMAAFETTGGASVGFDTDKKAFITGIQAAVTGAGKFAIWNAGRIALGSKKQLFAATGTAMNEHMALTYSGPGPFRKHTFNFVFYTKNRTEAENVSEIIQSFKVSMHPDLGKFTIKTGDSSISTGSGLDSAFFHYPDLFSIKFIIGGDKATAKKHYFEILPSVLESMNVSYDAENMVAMHKDGTPVGVKVDLTFQETTHVIAGSERKDRVYESAVITGPELY